jgi:anhydro-N-acetylmuramic acid kinase
MNKKMTVAGIMSGSSLDGIDISICNFELVSGKWTFEILAAETLPYSDDWKKKLSYAFSSSGEQLAKLHIEYGKFLGECCDMFFAEEDIYPELIASHGHTVFHQPQNGFTFQLGSGAAIAAITGIDTACDFRSTDVALGGQGAPLVPIGDQHLFGGHKFCLNLGGIANISYEENNNRLAFDICPANLPLNYLAGKLGKEFDEDGELAASGQIIPELLNHLNALTYYQQSAPKSLGREWFEKEFVPFIDDEKLSIEDRLRTVAEHIGIQIANALFRSPGTTMLTTGGGAFNDLLIEIIEEQVSRHGIHVVVPESNVVQFKEAIIFAFLGVLRVQNQTNTLSSVTGAHHNSIGGGIYSGGN